MKKFVQNGPSCFQKCDTAETFLSLDGTVECMGCSMQIDGGRLHIGGMTVEVCKNIDHIGGGFWIASLAMACFIDAKPEMFLGKRIIELGGGVGVPSLLLGKMGCDVVLSDIDIGLCQDAVARNGSTVKTMALDWEDGVEGEYDVAIACDCLYRHNDADFVKAVKCCNAGTVILVNSERDGIDEAIYAIEEMYDTCDVRDIAVEYKGMQADLKLVVATRNKI